MKTDDLLALVRLADPLQDVDDPAGHLDSARRVLDARTRGVPRPVPVRTWRRRLVTVLAVATVLPLAAVVVPALPGGPSPSRPLLGTATAGEGGLTCGTGYAQPIRPDTAAVRPFPTDLPSGWTVKDLFARSETSTGWCTVPSLNAATLDPSGLVTGSVTLTGPLRGVRVDDAETETPDRVGAYAARRLGPPLSGAPQFLRWIVTDERGEQWYAVANGYPLDRARELLAAATYVDRTVVWDAALAPGLRVLHRRTGAPYPTTSTGESWYLEFGGAGEGRTLEADAGRSDGSVGARAVVGTRLSTVDGRPALVYEQDGVPSSVYTELRPGVLMGIDVAGDLDDVERVLAGVVDLPEDDPRLDRLRLRESYEDRRGKD